MFLNLILLAKVVTDQHLKDLRETLKPPLLGQLGPHRAHRHDGGSVTGPPLAAIPENAVPDVQKTPLDELSVADSFIMEVLRGWGLLQAAGLTAEEKRNILSTTKNSLDYETIASALQSLCGMNSFLGNIVEILVLPDLRGLCG